MTNIKSSKLGFGIRAITVVLVSIFCFLDVKLQYTIFDLPLDWLLELGLIFLIINLAFFTWQNFILPYQDALQIADNLITGNTSVTIESNSDITNRLEQINNNFNEAASFSLAIGEGLFDRQLENLSSKEGLGFALNEMSLKLQNVAEEDRKRNWIFNGEAKFGELLRVNQDQSLQELSFIYIKELIKYIKANQGGVYIINNENSDKPLIELVAAYAFERRKFLHQSYEIGEGLIGQSVIEKDTIYIDDIPADYIKITSGLGTSNPRSIIIVPLMVNEEVLGVIEMASFHTLKPFEIQFIRQIAQGFAITIRNMQTNAKTQSLLEESRKATEELKAKEDDLKQNSTELIKIQEALNEKLVEIEKESAYTQSIVTAINSTNASLVMDLDGTILDVNEMYLSIMEYTREELLGKKEITFVVEDEIVTERYQMMLGSVKDGAYNSGEFRRINKSGRELWISGSYSPIFDVNGNAYKIVLFAQFTTEQKEKELELKSKIEAINSSIPTIELNLDLSVITANPIFLKDFGYKRMDMRNKKIDFVLEPNYTQSDEFVVLWDLVSEDNVMTQPLKMVTKEGVVKHYIANFSPTKNLIGQVYKVLIILIDLTEQNLLKEQLDLLLNEEKRKNALLNLKIDANESSFIDELVELLGDYENSIAFEKLNYLINSNNIPTLVFDNQLMIEDANSSLLNLIGSKLDMCINKSIFELLEIDENDIIQTTDKIHSNTLCQFKFRFKITNESNVYLNVYVVPFLEKDKYLVIVLNEEPTSDKY